MATAAKPACDPAKEGDEQGPSQKRDGQDTQEELQKRDAEDCKDADDSIGESSNEEATRKQVVKFVYNSEFDDNGELTVTQWSLKFLSKHDYEFYSVREQTTNEVVMLFFANKKSLQLLKKFPHVVIIDATYKTNKYNMSLVEMIGVTCTYETFNIAYAFTKEEKVCNYTWIMRKLRALFEKLGVMPTAIVTDSETALIKGLQHVFGDGVQHFLCWVHIKHKIKAHASKVMTNKSMVDAFVEQCWTVFCSTTEEIYEKRLESLRTFWKNGIVEYLEREWLIPYKINIVRAWTDHHLHFLTRTSNKIEGMNVVLNAIIGFNGGGFNTVIASIHYAIVMQINDIKRSMNTCLIKRPRDFDNPFMPKEIKMLFQRLFYRVSDKCFDHLLITYGRIMKDDYTDECTDFWVRSSLGLPCVHEMERAIVTKKPFVLDDIHDYWKQLSLADITPAEGDNDVNSRFLVAEMKILEMRSRFYSGTLKQDTVYKVYELYKRLECPDQTTMQKPTIEPGKKGKGRPQGARNEDKEKTREKRNFEHMQNESEDLEKSKAKGQEYRASEVRRVRPRKDSTSQVAMESVDLQSQPGVEDFQHEVEVQQITHMGVNFGVGNIDQFWIRYIGYAQDVSADGHCGYRSLALLIGMEEDGYKTVRHELLAELIENRELYEPISRKHREGSWNDLIRSVNYTRSPCGQEHWLSMPLMGLVFATRYQVGLVLLTCYAPTLCLPLRWRNPVMGIPSVNLGISHANCLNHFVPVMIQDRSPLPQPSGSWRSYADGNVKWWEEYFKRNITMYRDYRIAYGKAPDPVI